MAKASIQLENDSFYLSNNILMFSKVFQLIMFEIEIFVALVATHNFYSMVSGISKLRFSYNNLQILFCLKKGLRNSIYILFLFICYGLEYQFSIQVLVVRNRTKLHINFSNYLVKIVLIELTVSRESILRLRRE